MGLEDLLGSFLVSPFMSLVIKGIVSPPSVYAIFFILGTSYVTLFRDRVFTEAGKRSFVGLYYDMAGSSRKGKIWTQRHVHREHSM